MPRGRTSRNVARTARGKGAGSRSKAGAQSRKSGAASGVRSPKKVTGPEVSAVRHENEALGWLRPTLEEAYAQLAPRSAPQWSSERAAPAAAAPRRPGGPAALAQVGRSHWSDLLREYRSRAAAAAGVRHAPPVLAAAASKAPSIPGARNWRPLGPTVVLEGQTVGEQPVGGRISGIAVARDGRTVYAASANGGVFRSDDGANAWRSLMDGFDLDPTRFASASLTCGAIAIDPADPRRLYVGTGEGDTAGMFEHRIVHALPAYRGVGAIRSDDGGETWNAEASTPDLAGEAFFALAVDPHDREHVVGATTIGLYERTADPGGGHAWIRRVEGTFSSAVVAASGTETHFFAAKAREGVFHSTDGKSWSPAGTDFPAHAGRIALAVQPGSAGVVYAFAAAEDGTALGLFRLDGVGASWKPVSKLPDVLPGKQGDYDLAVALDPQDPELVYLAGDYANVEPWPGSIWRVRVEAAGAGYQVSESRLIGTHAHADVHVIVHSPGNPDQLWCGCDGGLFLNQDPRGTGEFASRNVGLSCLCSNFIGQHPTDPNILFTGLQDNGTARSSGGSTWTHVNYGDGGYCVVNWADPTLVLVFANGTVFRSKIGGDSHESWHLSWNFPWATMTQPIVSAPRSAKKADANVVAVAAGRQISVSTDFAQSWPQALAFVLPAGVGDVFALAFASPKRLFMGTVEGEVFRADLNRGKWTVTRIDDAAGGPLEMKGLITDVAVDVEDPARERVYVSFGGVGDRRRVWWFDGKRWESRSGSPGKDLLDVEHNAIAVDPVRPGNLYVGADVGVWHSADRGLTWEPLQNGLPDAPVYDLQIHPTRRLLRAATHGRGVYELQLD